MSAAMTVLAFTAITLAAVLLHLRAHRAPAPEATGEADKRSCPRCGAAVRSSTPICPSCRVPLQVYEVVGAEIVAEETRRSDEGDRLHAIVRADVCVGCGTCVDACPEPGAIRVEAKRALVDLAACVGHGSCAEACPVGAIVLSTGEAVQRVEVPDVDTSFESNVAGLYIAGELGGRGLIKNAINEAKVAVENLARRIEKQRDRQRPDADLLDLLIVGAGPAGLSAALAAQAAGLRYTAVERGTLADSIRKYPRRKLLLAEPVKVPLYGDLWIADASKESLLKVWEAMIVEKRLNVETNHEVTAIERSGDVFLVTAGGRRFRARYVLLAMGRRGTPRRLGVPGEDLAKTLYDIVEMEAFAGRRVLVVGGGDSAVESAVGLANQPGTQVTLSYRSDRFSKVKARNQDKLDRAVRAGRVNLLLNSQVREIRSDSVVVDVEGRQQILPNDEVIIRIGGEPPVGFLQRVGVRMVRKDVPIPQASEAAVG